VAYEGYEEWVTKELDRLTADRDEAREVAREILNEAVDPHGPSGWIIWREELEEKYPWLKEKD
jgi:hypothetical protein